jgi:large subunit ribosomal protein L4
VSGKKSKDVTLEAGIFGAEVKPHLVHETVRAEQNAARGGTRAVKSRGLVAGGRGKPWRQKGTGRARAGTTRAPQWTGGGAAFQPRTSFDVKVNKKARKAAFRAALSAHAQEGTLAFVDGAAFSEPSTKQAASLLYAWTQNRPILVVATEQDEALVKSFRNLERVLVIAPDELEVSALLWARALLVSESARELIERRAA